MCGMNEWLKDFVFIRICNAITKSHPQRSDVYKSDLDKTLPNIQEIQAAFVKLKHLCVDGNFIFIIYVYIYVYSEWVITPLHEACQKKW